MYCRVLGKMMSIGLTRSLINPKNEMVVNINPIDDLPRWMERTVIYDKVTAELGSRVRFIFSQNTLSGRAK